MASSTTAKRKSGSLADNIKTFIYAGLIAIGVRTFLFEPFNIPSGSMIPTLMVGDYIFVSKFSYGYSRFSFPFSPPLFGGRIFGSLPHYGDVVVFKLPRDTSVDYIKRIVGLPGDRIQVQHGILTINGQAMPRTPDGTCVASDEGPPVVGRQYVETLPGGVKHDICKLYDEGGLNDTEVYVVPPGTVFAMGDNRDNSQDSRVLSAVGYVPVENIVGRAEIVWFSIDATAPFWEVWEWPFEIRWSRLFTGIS